MNICCEKTAGKRYHHQIIETILLELPLSESSPAHFLQTIYHRKRQ